MKIKITADSTLDLPPEQLAEYDIGVIPLTIALNGTPHKDGVDVKPSDLFECVEAGGTASTSAINTAEYEEFFGKLLKSYDAIVHINISSGISLCHQSACMAAEGKPIYPVDSKSLSSSGGLLAIRGAEMARAGISAEEIAEKLRALAPTIESTFVIDTLKYLHRGGRCSSLQALGANLLQLKPCIVVNTETGTMGVGKKYRGKFETVILQYVDDRLANRNDIDTRMIMVTCPPTTPRDIVEKVRERVAQHHNFDVILTTDASCTIACHCGPICLGVLFYTKQ